MSKQKHRSEKVFKGTDENDPKNINKIQELETNFESWINYFQLKYNEHESSIKNQNIKMAKLEKSLEALKSKLKEGNKKIKSLQAKLKATATDDDESQQSQYTSCTRCSEPEVQSPFVTTTAKRRLNYDVLAASEYSRSQISFTGRRRSPSNYGDFRSRDQISASRVPLRSNAEILTGRPIDTSPKMGKTKGKTVNNNSKSQGKLKDRVETWMEESNILEIIGADCELTKETELELRPKSKLEEEKSDVEKHGSKRQCNGNSGKEVVVDKEEENAFRNDEENQCQSESEQELNPDEILATTNENPTADSFSPTGNAKRKLTSKKAEHQQTEELSPGSKKKKRLHSCQICEKLFQTSRSSQDHFSQHSNSPKVHLCEDCEAISFRVDLLDWNRKLQSKE